MKNRVTNKLFSAVASRSSKTIIAVLKEVFRKAGLIFSAVASWSSKINMAALKEDFRKAGLVLIGAGYIRVIVGGDKISSLEGVILSMTGFFVWYLSLIQETDDGN
jgi:hypothetical protein